MKNRVTSSEAGAYLAHAKSTRWPMMCPCCGAKAARVERRWSDLLLSLVVPVRRYRCPVQRCGWQGIVRYD